VEANGLIGLQKVLRGNNNNFHYTLLTCKHANEFILISSISFGSPNFFVMQNKNILFTIIFTFSPLLLFFLKWLYRPFWCVWWNEMEKMDDH
jgi:hypothetical protein